MLLPKVIKLKLHNFIKIKAILRTAITVQEHGCESMAET